MPNGIVPSPDGDRSTTMWPSNVGILALEYVGSRQYVSQSELETYDGVPAGKYTLGLGQDRMGFCVDREDINSLCLTVVDRLMKRQTFGYDRIGRLEVGTETVLDKSKSVKTVLMQLFEGSGNSDVEGVDATNACYGGTAALFNALAWVESSAWDGRLALVVAGDIAVYAEGSARPTGGAGAIAMLVGPDAPLIIDRGARATHMRHVYDFYKPVLNEYPTVDGKLSIQCYLSALDQCYQLYCKKAMALHTTKTGGPARVTLDNLDAVLFHSPYCKLVQKSLARLLFNDFKNAPDADLHLYPGLEKYRKTCLEDTYLDRDLEKACLALSGQAFDAKTRPSLRLAQQVGNMYTASLYGGLVSWLVSQPPAASAGKRVALFSYGSGLASSMYSLHVTKQSGPGSALDALVAGLAGTGPALDARVKYSPEDFSVILAASEKNHYKAPFEPTFPVEKLSPDTWYLVRVDDKHRRHYQSNAAAAPCHNHNSSALNNHQQ